MRVLADANMPYVEALFPNHDITRFSGRDLAPEALVDVDALLVRSITPVNDALLTKANALKFVGTATIGREHVDEALLAERGIAFSSAPGCNAVAVAEYVVSSILALGQEQGFDVKSKTVGIVGLGNIGQTLKTKLAVLGVTVLECDPPRALAEEDDGFLPLETLLKKADIISFHVPKIAEGEHKTVGLLGAQNLAELKKNAIIINASRGDVIDNQALCEHLADNPDATAVLDVWENEPNVNQGLLAHTHFATTHIAGHTFEGKARGTLMLAEAWHQLNDMPYDLTLEHVLPTPSITDITLSDGFTQEAIKALVHLVYDVRRDDALMRLGLNKKGFDALRKSYPMRREFSSLRVHTSDNNLAIQLATLGFSLAKK